MSETQVQVLIVGGGIVGLSASLFLSSHGIKSLLVERHAGTSIHPRARSVNARTMELYRGLGIDEAVREAGASLSSSMGIYKGSSLVEVIDPVKRRKQAGEQKFPLDNLFGSLGPLSRTRGTQDMIEPVLLAAARARGGDLRFDVECTSFDQDDRGVYARLRDRSKNSETIVHAHYLIAADGAGSQIRQKLDVATTGAGALGYLLNILFEADLREFVERREFSMCYIDRPEVCGLLTSINNSDRWVFHLSYDPTKDEKAEEFTQQRCQGLVKMALSMPDIDVKVKSNLPWTAAVKVAEKFQHGRVFLAGDAAHQMPPWRGLGANTGIADVHNLAWKLAAVLRNQATTELLATYDSERLPIGRLVSEESGAATDDRGLFSTKITFGAVLDIIRKLPRMNGYGYSYESRAINKEDTIPLIWRHRWLMPSIPWLFSVGGVPGTRAPHIWVRSEGRQISTLDLLGKGFILLAGSDGDKWHEASLNVAQSLGIELNSYRVGPTGDIVCPKGKFESAAWISETGALLVRPDGFVAWRVWQQRSDARLKLTAVLMQVLCRDK